MTRRILVIQLERLGDLVQTTPLLIGLSRAIPQATIDVLAWTEFASIIEGLPGVTLRTLPSRHVRDLNDDVEQARARNLEPHSALRSLAELALPAYDRIINVTHGAFASWLSGRLSAPVRDGGFINETGEWLYAGDWLTLLVAMSEIRRENLINIVALVLQPDRHPMMPTHTPSARNVCRSRCLKAHSLSLHPVPMNLNVNSTSQRRFKS